MSESSILNRMSASSADPANGMYSSTTIAKSSLDAHASVDFPSGHDSRVLGGASEQLEYWRDSLRGAGPLQVPTDRPRTQHRVPCIDRIPLTLPVALTRRLRNLARQHHVSLFSTLLSGWAALLSRWSGQEDVLLAARDRTCEGVVPTQGDALVLRVVVPPDACVERVLKLVQNSVSDAHSHANVALEHVIELLSDEYERPVRVLMELREAEEVGVAHLRPAALNAATAIAPLELALLLNDVDGHINGVIEYDASIFDQETVERLAACWREMLQGMAKHPRRAVSQLGMLTAMERERVLYRNNETTVEYPRERLLHELFEEQASKLPSAPAVICAGQVLTYAQLNERANKLAHHLRARGVVLRDRVGICLDRGVEMVVAILGVLKSGAAYVPLDPSYPSERIGYLLEDAAPTVVLTQQSLSDQLPPPRSPVVLLDAQWEEITAQHGSNPSTGDLTSEDLAYVMYTSGSTGQPKGVMVRHRNVVNYAWYAAEQFDVRSGEGSLIGTSMSFDLALTGFYPPLICGRTVRLCSPGEDLSQALLSGRNYAPVKLTPTHLSTLSLPEDRIRGCVRTLVVGGEQLQGSTLRWWREHSPQTRIFNHYGPTEATIGCVVNEVHEDIDGPVPIGRPISNAQVYILDAHRAPVPVGVVGEIYIGGDGVAAGYWNRPQLSAERFLVDPFSSDPRARMYKTGDLGRWRAEGSVEYLGRNDDQVKIRGFRVELGETAARLVEHAQVKEAVVIAREERPGDKRLIAYLTSSGASKPSAENLRNHLRPLLPEYMVPSAFVVLDRLPITQNGKLDKHALPAPEADAYASRDYIAPQGEMEQALAQIWQELLKVERVGRADHFFELGGHSLLILQLLERIRALGHCADARSIYQYPVLQEFSGHVTTDATERVSVPPNRIPRDCSAITPDMLPLIDLESADLEQIAQTVPGGACNVQDIYPLAPLQEGILFHHAYRKGSDTYVIPTLLAVESQERLVQLIAALQAVVDRHDVLRTAILWEHLPKPVQVVYREVQLPVEQFTLDGTRSIREQLDQRMEPDSQRMDLSRAPLLRLCVAADPHGSRRYAVLQIHHIISDHESTAKLLLEVMTGLRGELKTLPAPIAYREHISHLLAHAETQDAETFFRSKLGDIDEPTAPFGLLDVRGESACLLESQETLDPVLASRIRAQARRLGVSAATLFHAAWALLASATSGRHDVVFGTLLLGRMQGGAAAQGALGMFINTLPLRIALRSLSAAELVERTHRELIELLSHEQASLAVAQRCSGVGGSAPLFTSLLNYVHGTLRHESVYRSIGSGVEILGRREWTNYPILVSVEDRSDAFVLSAQTDRRLAPGRLTAYLRTAVTSLVEALDHAPLTPALKLRVLPTEEWRQVIHDFNSTTRPYPRDRRISKLFEEQVARAPDAPAVIYEQQVLNFRELNAAANRFARHLHQHGVQAGEYVVILMERSLVQVIAQLAILKCGAVYVPVDPKLPRQRQIFMIEDCGARRVLVETSAAARDAFTSQQWISFQESLHSTANLPAENLELADAAMYPAYVMYTSGSTGTPKGVVVPHHAVVRLIVNNGYADLRSDDCFCYCSNPTFDAATFEVWGALLTGARLLIVPHATVLEPDRFARVLEENGTTIVWLTIGLFMQYADVLGRVFSRARYVMTGGDVVDPAIVRRVLRESAPQNLMSAYGPTECTTFTTTCLVNDLSDSETSIPIGRPMANASIYLLNAQLQPVPVGAVGEIYIGGAGVALGYLSRPELTAERFLPDPFSDDPAARFYKSGDLGRWREDGKIEFVGRNDQQVKIRGFRIELGEIEAHLSRYPQVREAVVVVRGERAGRKQLVAYVTVTEQGELNAEALRAHVSAALPEYMVPAAFVVMPRMPLTPNGKLDRRALPEPDVAAFASCEYEHPQGDVEEVLAAIWAELLQMQKVGRRDNFFELGGHSLLAMQLIVRIRSALSIDVPMSEIFEQPSLTELAERVDALRDEKLISRLESGGAAIDELLDSVASMSEQEVYRMMSKLDVGARQ